MSVTIVQCPTGRHASHRTDSGIYTECLAASQRSGRGGSAKGRALRAPAGAPPPPAVENDLSVPGSDPGIKAKHRMATEALGAQHGADSARQMALTEPGMQTALAWEQQGDSNLWERYSRVSLSSASAEGLTSEALLKQVGATKATPGSADAEALSASYEERYAEAFRTELVRRAKALDYAIGTARENIPVQKSVRREESWVSMVIVDQGSRLGVYRADAWQEPTELPLLPWSPPSGTVVGRVGLDGSYSPVEHSGL